MYIPRSAEKLLIRYLGLFPCVALTGPRQAGKSTLVRHLLADTPYVTFDDPQEELAFHLDPEGFLGRYAGPVVLDEVQRVPDLLRYLKIRIDTAPDIMGRYILTGSNQLSLQRGISESLAGRVGLVSLLPLERSELPESLRTDQLLTGSYPALAVRGNSGYTEWFGSYLATYLEKDVRQVFDIGKLADFQLCLRLLAARTSQEHNASSLSRETGVSSNTIDKWISVMEAGYVLFLLKPFHANIGKRLVKRPKVYFWDTGLVCSLTGIRDLRALEDGPLGGPVFENLVVAELFKMILHRGLSREMFYYRDNGGNETDLVIHDKETGSVTLMEIKSGHTAKPVWAEQLNKTAEIIKNSSSFPGAEFRTCIVYRGETRKDWPRKGCDFINFESVLKDPGLSPL
jgi:predicted AAA+ superfamily ATPase